MKKVNIAINVIMGLMIVLLLYRINKTDNRFLEIQKHLLSQDSLKVKKLESNKSKEISKVGYVRVRQNHVYSLKNQSPFVCEQITEVLYNPNRYNLKDKVITKFYCEVDTTNFKFYELSPRTKTWRKINLDEIFGILIPSIRFGRYSGSFKIIKPNEDPNTAKDLSERE
jgi:hypothetical protein